MSKRIFLSLLAVTLVLALGGIAFAEEAAAPQPPYKVGDKIAEIKLKTLDGKEINLIAQLQKKTYVTFMTTACRACMEEIKDLRSVMRKVGPDKADVIIVAVDMNGEQTVPKYEERWKWGFTYMLDPDFTAPPLFQFNSTPSMFLLDKDGTLLMKKSGYAESQRQAFQEELANLVK